MKKAVSFLFSMFLCIGAFAQDQEVRMADAMRSNGKIYIVVAVILTIFAGLIIYLVRLDRKIGRLEKNLKS